MKIPQSPPQPVPAVPKKKYNVWKSIGKGLWTGVKGALVLAPMVVDTLQGAGVKISGSVIVVLAVAKAVNNYIKNRDKATERPVSKP